MQDDSAATTPNYIELTSDVVSAYVSNNAVSLARTAEPDRLGTCRAFGGVGTGSREGKADASSAHQQDDPA